LGARLFKGILRDTNLYEHFRPTIRIETENPLPGMATAVADLAGEDSTSIADTGGIPTDVVSDDQKPTKSTEEVKPVKTLNAASSATLASGPPILHPTVTIWQWLFAASDMKHTPTVIHSGTTPEQERFWRWKGAQLIFRIGDYMRL